MKKCVELDNGIPLVVLSFPSLTYLGENFKSVTSSSWWGCAWGDWNDTAGFSLTKVGSLRRAGRGSWHWDAVRKVLMGLSIVRVEQSCVISETLAWSVRDTVESSTFWWLHQGKIVILWQQTCWVKEVITILVKNRSWYNSRPSIFKNCLLAVASVRFLRNLII